MIEVDFIPLRRPTVKELINGEFKKPTLTDRIIYAVLRVQYPITRWWPWRHFTMPPGILKIADGTLIANKFASAPKASPHGDIIHLNKITRPKGRR